MSFPGVKKDAQGRWYITGVQERYISQQQADAEEIVKSAEKLNATDAFKTRQLLYNAPELSAGVLSSLVSAGANPQNQLVKNLAEIDAITRAQRAQDDYKEAQRISTEKFNNTWRGRIWNFIKGASRGAALLATVPIEAVSNAAADISNQFDQLRGKQVPDSKQIDYLKTSTLYNVVDNLIHTGKVDLGSGFGISEETGAGFLARKTRMDVKKLAVDINGKTFYRPYSFFDPITSVITGGNADTGVGSVVTAIGELVGMFATDPFLAGSKIVAAKEEAAKIARTSSGFNAAKAMQRQDMLDAQLQEAVNATNTALADLKSAASTGKNTVEKERIVADLIQKQVQIATEADGITYDLEAVANFISGPQARAAIDTLAEISDWKKIHALGKRFGRNGGFNVEQAVAISKATTREEVLRVIAPYIAKGEVVVDALQTGTKVGQSLRATAQAIDSKVAPALSRVTRGQNIAIANKITGLAASGYQKIPYMKNLAGVLNNKINDVKMSWQTAMPKAQLIHVADKDALVSAVYSYGRSLNVPENVLNNIVDTVALSEDASKAGYQASGRLFNEIYKANADKAHVNKDTLKELTRVFESERKKMSSYWAQQHISGAKIRFQLGKNKVELTGPHIESELLNSSVYFPDAKQLMREISTFNRFAKLGKVTDALQNLTDGWKKLVLVRPAYIIRNIAEEQIRVLGTGHMSFFNSPLAATAMWLGRDSGPAWRRLLNKFDPYNQTIMGKNFKLASAEEEFSAEVLAHDAAYSYLQSQSINGVSGIDDSVRNVMFEFGFRPVGYGHDNWWQGLASEIRVLNNSTIARAVARTAPGRESATIDYLLRGAGREDYMKFVSAQQNKEVANWLLTDEGAMQYLFTGKNSKNELVSLAERINQAAGGNGEASTAIRKLIAFGNFTTENMDVRVPKPIDSARNSIKNASEMSAGRKKIKDINQQFADILQRNFDGKGNWDGILMNVPDTRVAGRNKATKLLKEVSDSFFQLAIKFEKTSTMGPEWRQKYWETIRDISKSLDSDAVSNLKTIAKDSLAPLKNYRGEPIGKRSDVWKALDNATGDGAITAEEAHAYASRVASRHVAELFYDASKKRLLFHQLRLILPFGQAWEDTIKAWGRIALNNPEQAYRIKKSLDWLSDPSSSALYQLTDAKDYYDPNQGFFFTDPNDGQRKFYIPLLPTGLNFLTNLANFKISTKGPYTAVATPQSLNFAFASGSIIPGVGPVLSIALGALDSYGVNPLSLLPPSIEDGIRKVIFPFGQGDLSRGPLGVLEGALPANWRRVIGGEPAYASAMAPVMNYLATSGGYNLDNVDDQAKLLKDSDKFAKWFTLWRGVLGSASAFPITPQAITKDKGDVMLSLALINDFKQLEINANGDRNKAYADFLDLYGPEQLFAIISKTTGAPVNLATYEMVRKDPSVATDYPDVYGYIYPNGGVSQEMYKWQQRQGNKKSLTKEEIMNAVTRIRYFAARDRVMTRAMAEGWSNAQTASVMSNLKEAYAMKGLTITFDASKDARVESQLYKAATDPRFQDSDAIKGLNDYLYLREQALSASGRKTLSNAASLPQREWLAGQAKDIISRHPEFYKLFYAFFKDELKG